MLALVSFTSTVYPSLIGTRPPSLLFLSKHVDAHAQTHTHTRIHSRVRMYSRGPARTYTCRGVMGTSGGAHPMHRQTFPGEHQKNHQRGFKRAATANPNTHTDTHTHTPLGCRGKRPDQMSGGNKEHLFALEGIAALMVNSPSTRAGFLPSRCVSSTHPHIYTYTLCHPARITGPPGHRDSQVVRGAFFFFHKTISVCQGQAVWPRTSPHNTQSEAGREDQYTACVCVW